MVGLILLVTAAGCIGATKGPKSTVRVCDQTLAEYIAGRPTIFTIGGSTRDRPAVPTRGFLLRVTGGCSKGVAVSITPTGLLCATRVVTAADGQLIALALQATGEGTARIIASRSNIETGRFIVPVLRPLPGVQPDRCLRPKGLTD